MLLIEIAEYGPLGFVAGRYPFSAGADPGRQLQRSGAWHKRPIVVSATPYVRAMSACVSPLRSRSRASAR
jgi:hypothetical protein